MIYNILETINPVLWVISNCLIFIITFLLLVFLLSYNTLYNRKATTVGKYTFRFMFSLFCVIGVVDLGILLDPRIGIAFWEMPADTTAWLPLIKLLAHAYVTYTIAALVVVLIVRRWYPNRIKIRPDLDLLIPKNPHMEETDERSSSTS